MQTILSAHEFKKLGFFVFKVMYDKVIILEISMSHFELVSIFYYQAKSVFGLSKSFRRIYLFYFKLITINGSGIVDSGVIRF